MDTIQSVANDTARPVASVAIVGRPNVGKSALFNCLVGRRISIVHDQPGVTRDRVAAAASTRNFSYELLDTGGIGSQIDDSFDEQVRAEADIAIASADLILFVVDAKAGLTPVDLDLASHLRKAGCAVVVVANKIDHDKHESLTAEITSLGYPQVVATSAAHARGIGALKDIIDQHLQVLDTEGNLDSANKSGIHDAPKIAIVGRPNVGKSSLINALLRAKRTIVSDVSGTTRDAIDIPFRARDNDYVLIDTAGIRPKGRNRGSVEVFSVIRSEKSIRRADLCILVVDAADGVTSQDKKIAGIVQQANRPCIVVVNKWDLVAENYPDKKDKKLLIEQLRADLFFIDYAPCVFLSARSGKYVSRLFREVEGVAQAAQTRLPTATLNQLVHDTLAATPPPLVKGKRFKILYLTQLTANGPIPVPSFIVFTNNAQLAPPQYMKFLERQIRLLHPLAGLPVIFELRSKEKRYANKK